MARTKNRFNAMVVPETVSADMPVTIVRSFRVALYARLSVELKARPSESIANQLDIMREYVKGKAEFAEWYEYVDNAVSGTNFDRHVIDEEDWIIVENTHEPIVDKELFDRVRKVLGQKVFSSDRGRNLPIKDDIFAGILFCGNCKRRIPQLSRIVEKDGRLERQYFYSCKYNYDFGGEKCGCTILEQELVKAVYKILEVNIAALSDCGKMENVLQSAMEKELKKCDVQIRQLEKKIEKLNYEESKGYQGYVTGEVSKEEFRRMQEKSSDAVMRLRGTDF